MKLIIENWRSYVNEESGVVSCGILAYRENDGQIEFLLGTPPNANYWTVFKGIKEDEEGEREAAEREFEEEALNGVRGAFKGEYVSEQPFLGTVGAGKRKKQLKIWLVKMDMDVSTFVPNTSPEHTIDAPGQWFDGEPEIVDIKWFNPPDALDSMPKSQKSFINQAMEILR